ncbi:HNH endonuclease signature motif containing protein [Tautonia plasticadhaerens]|uniref:Putative HNH nuclease YajD n=1 Tax=Tautonia plasticadhaerens TaxID=2527974 RepID=A0A518GZM4_9BACT|nr:HNH endonuclease signature motif containing protein [Tautonia plasticadhaerens]QDV34031.1 HNH endonuclease [Tautonia plasticadhaerens]
MPRRIPSYRPPWSPAPRKPHERPIERTEDRKADRRWYMAKPWRSLRALVLAEEPLCRLCREHGRLTVASHVDHIRPRKERPDLALDRSNLRPLCRSCHNRVRAAEDGRGGGPPPGPVSP